jgi:hypothetical protein
MSREALDGMQHSLSLKVRKGYEGETDGSLAHRTQMPTLALISTVLNRKTHPLVT